MNKYKTMPEYDNARDLVLHFVLKKAKILNQVCIDKELDFRYMYKEDLDDLLKIKTDSKLWANALLILGYSILDGDNCLWCIKTQLLENKMCNSCAYKKLHKICDRDDSDYLILSSAVSKAGRFISDLTDYFSHNREWIKFIEEYKIQVEKRK